MINVVVISKVARKALKSVPKHVAEKFLEWVVTVEEIGIEETRKRPGYHDEPLQGQLAGSRSIRLSRAYRAYYRIEGNRVECVLVTGVDKHEY